MAITGEMENFYLKWGKPGMVCVWGTGGWFYNGGNGKFLKSLYIVGRGVLTPSFYEDLPILPIPPF